MWFISVEVEQETSAPPPKKNPGSAPAYWLQSFIEWNLTAFLFQWNNRLTERGLYLTLSLRFVLFLFVFLLFILFDKDQTFQNLNRIVEISLAIVIKVEFIL